MNSQFIPYTVSQHAGQLVIQLVIQHAGQHANRPRSLHLRKSVLATVRSLRTKVAGKVGGLNAAKAARATALSSNQPVT